MYTDNDAGLEKAPDEDTLQLGIQDAFHNLMEATKTIEEDSLSFLTSLMSFRLAINNLFVFRNKPLGADDVGKIFDELAKKLEDKDKPETKQKQRINQLFEHMHSFFSNVAKDNFEDDKVLKLLKSKGGMEDMEDVDLEDLIKEMSEKARKEFFDKAKVDNIKDIKPREYIYFLMNNLKSDMLCFSGVSLGQEMITELPENKDQEEKDHRMLADLARGIYMEIREDNKSTFNWKNQGKTPQEITNKFKKNAIEIIEIEKKIKKIYENRKEALTLNIPKSDWHWHEAFVAHAASKYPGDQKQKLKSLIRNSSLGIEKLIPRPDLEQRTKLNDYSNQISGAVLSSPKDKKDEIIQFSMLMSECQDGYKMEFEAFKKENTADLEKKCVIETLKDIKKLIEEENWKLGRWGSSTKINVEGQPKPKEVPNHAYKIYKKIENAHLDTADYKSALKILEEVQEIARKATTDKPMFFEKDRQRDATTQKAYEVIEEQSAKTLESFSSNYKEQLKDIKKQGEEPLGESLDRDMPGF